MLFGIFRRVLPHCMLNNRDIEHFHHQDALEFLLFD